jgi:hypothetical protein
MPSCSRIIRLLAVAGAASGFGAWMLPAMVSPAIAGPPFVTDDPEPVDYQHFEINGFTQGTHVRGETAGTLAGVDANYGLVPNVQVHMLAPLAFDRRGGSATRFGYGDTEFGVKYRFIEGQKDGWRPQVALYPFLEVPTGDAERHLGTGHTRAFFPLWLQWDIGPWTTYGGGGYWVNPGSGNQDYWFAGWVLQRKVADDLVLGGEMFQQTAVIVDGKPSVGFNLGGTYDFNQSLHLLFSAGRGLVNAPTTNQASYFMGIRLTY